MPIYEYRCKECQQVFEEWCKHVEDGKTTLNCPICKGEAERLISNTTFALKGGGWYVTEYGNRKDKTDGESSAKTPSADSGAASSSPAPSSEASSAPSQPASS